VRELAADWHSFDQVAAAFDAFLSVGIAGAAACLIVAGSWLLIGGALMSGAPHGVAVVLNLRKGIPDGRSAADHHREPHANRRREATSERHPMISINHNTALSVTAGLWAAAVGSAIMLTRELNRPLHEAGAAAHGITPFVAALLAAGWIGLAGVIFGGSWGRLRHVLVPARA
jgi:hypothetical protein